MHSLKKTIIKGLATATTIDSLKSNKLLLVTPLGVISGVVCTAEDENQDNVGFQFLNEVTEKLTADYGKENIRGNDGYLTLSDVTIITGSNGTINCPNLIVFYDQIIGVTLGNPA